MGWNRRRGRCACTAALCRDGYAVRTVGETIYMAGRDNTTEKGEILFRVKTPFGREAGRCTMVNERGVSTAEHEGRHASSRGTSVGRQLLSQDGETGP